ncbi:MAG: peptidoglycan DD-metalloendopeptidase family protein, partial [Clostridia bacterium]|nr:peptidoglycan DD-metalloendopeptidase family protein [Clostridia bacterium]
MLKISPKLKRIISLVVAVLMVIFVCSTVIINFASADQKTDLESKQQSLNSDKQEIRDEINALQEQKDSVMAEKKILDDEVTVLETEIAEINAKIDEIQGQIDEVTIELEDAAERLEKQYEAYKTRVRVMYENSSVGYLEILLSAESIGDFFARLEIVSQIAEYDSNLVAKLKAEKQKIQDKKDELELLKQEQVDSRTSLESKKSDLDAKMAKRDAIIKQINSSKSTLEAELKKIEDEEKKVRAQIARLASGGTVYTGGAMMWPTPSCRYITSYYGWRLHPVLGYEKLHTGIDIGAGYNAKIIAAESGTVITATYNSAYGNYVVVDHGGGVCTLYAHQSSMAVSVGQYVLAGDTIGYVGSTGYSTGPHLHFEV